MRFRSQVGAAWRASMWAGFLRLPQWLVKAAGHERFRVSDALREHSVDRIVVFRESESPVLPNRNIFRSVHEGVQTTRFPELAVLHFQDARVLNNSRFNSVFLGSSVLIPQRQESGPWALYKGRTPRVVANVVGQQGDVLVWRRQPVAYSVPRALYVGSRAPYNWYHWLANLLPALHVANLSGLDSSIPLLLPETIRRTPQMIESLEIFRAGRKVLWVPDRAVVHVDDLHWAESPVLDAPFSSHKSNRLPLALHSGAMTGFRDRILEHCQPTVRSGRGNRIYLARKVGMSRSFNGNEVEAWAKEQGFSITFTEELSFCDQVALLHAAEFVIGPTGAAFTNILFAPSRARFLRFVGRTEPFENYFSNLSSVSGSEIVDVPATQNEIGEGFVLEHQAFSRAIEFFAHPRREVTS